jgi:hypothetical protein
MTDPVALQLSADMQGYVDRGDVPGLATLVLRAGEEVHCDVLGQRDFGDAPPPRRDALWRLGWKTGGCGLRIQLIAGFPSSRPCGC